MAKDLPPVPPDNRSDKGPGDAPEVDLDTRRDAAVPNNTAEEGRQGNISQNTHHQGHQQDR